MDLLLAATVLNHLGELAPLRGFGELAGWVILFG
jgi:hypothetical protein